MLIRIYNGELREININNFINDYYYYKEVMRLKNIK